MLLATTVAVLAQQPSPVASLLIRNVTLIDDGRIVSMRAAGAR
jgi:hypothetical protein